MCQGVIVSLVKFQNDKGKNKRAVLKGIGSHSSLIKDNQKLLKKLGWTENAKNQEVISVESDFSGWNKFTVESGNPTKVDSAILRRAYKECASNAKVLIAHVKRIGNIDNALVDLLTAQAKKVYDDTIAPAKKVYYDTIAQAEKVYYDTIAQAKKVYDDTIAQAKKVYDDKAVKTWAKLFKSSKNRIECLR